MGGEDVRGDRVVFSGVAITERCNGADTERHDRFTLSSYCAQLSGGAPLATGRSNGLGLDLNEDLVNNHTKVGC